MWRFNIYFYDPDTVRIRKFVSQNYYPTFLEACLAVDLAVKLRYLALLETEDHWIIQDIEILEETFLEAKEKSQNGEVG